MLSLFAVMVAASAMLLVLVLGFVWLLALSGNAGWIDQNDVVGSAFRGAIQPFVIWDILKMALAALTVTGAWGFLAKR